MLGGLSSEEELMGKKTCHPFVFLFKTTSKVEIVLRCYEL